MKMKQGFCPQCGKNELEYEFVEECWPDPEGPVQVFIKFPFTCRKCKFKAVEFYIMIFAGTMVAHDKFGDINEDASGADVKIYEELD